MLGVVLIWGGNYSFIKLALREIPPFAYAALRFTTASTLLLLLLRVREGPLRRPAGKEWRILLLGLLGHTAYQALFMTGMSRTTAVNGALIISSTPVLVLILGAVTGTEHLAGRMIVAVLLAVGGVTLVLTVRGPGFDARALMGDVAVLGAACCWAAYTVGVRAFALPVSALRLTAYTMAAGTPGLLLLGLPQAHRVDWGGVSATAWAAVAYATVLGLVVSYIALNRAVQMLGSGRTAIFNSIVPLVAVLAAWMLLGEHPVATQLAGAGLIVTGVLLSRRGDADEVAPEGA